ncbi:hypothetical protein EYF80_019076 [Liparis tanakae]|uniref:Uncharacterized protein n=1 Tax=Liparis tanakae TaxID=230148 RepID=A0A4Z2HXS2_9TELE|nr:hypothetical protein EYF80_019076 [Liparis tanakae]
MLGSQGHSQCRDMEHTSLFLQSHTEENSRQATGSHVKQMPYECLYKKRAVLKPCPANLSRWRNGTSGELATIWSYVAFMQPDGLALNGLHQSGMALSWLSVVIIRLQ